jgi:hypothetical protein
MSIQLDICICAGSYLIHSAKARSYTVAAAGRQNKECGLNRSESMAVVIQYDEEACGSMLVGSGVVKGLVTETS